MLALRSGINGLGKPNSFFEEMLENGPTGGITIVHNEAATVDEARIREIADEQIKAGARPTLVVKTAAGKVVSPIEGVVHSAAFKCTVLAQRKHLLIVGPAGSGKTTLATQIAKLLPNMTGENDGVGRPFYCTGAVFRESKLLGYTFPDKDGNVHYVTTAFREAWDKGGLFLFDEVDGSDPNALVAFNQALANGVCAFPDSPIARPAHPDFRAICAANTFGRGATRLYVGRNALDAAFLDRFAVWDVDYDRALERTLSGDHEWCDMLHAIRSAVDKLDVQLIVGTRAILDGGSAIADFMACGDDRATAVKDALAAFVWKGLAAVKVKAICLEAGISADV
tara:strand:+ start:2741 stop:3757 length:1017 start_codon:yes stop_codon:yes gene_type:complete